jgi:lysozyme family protein
MTIFKESFMKLMKAEGGYSNHPSDRGKETYKGIARNRHHAWKGWSIIDGYKNFPDFEKRLDEDGELQLLVDAFYKTMFWDDINLDQVLSQAICDEIFDIAINMGAGTAVKFVQTALNLLNRNQKDFPDLKVDGGMGQKTIATLNSYKNEKALLKTLNGLQFERYREICSSDPTQEVFFLGWLTRV